MRNLIYFILIAFISSCSNQTDNNDNGINDFFDRVSKSYIKGKIRFKKEYVSHFPDKIDRNLFLDFNESVSPEGDMIRLTLFNKASEKEIKKLKKKYKNSIGIYSAADSCLLVVNRFATMENNTNIKINASDKKLINRDCYFNKYPIPNFWHNQFTNDSTECRLSEDFTVYVIKAESGIFLDKEKLSDGRFMSEKWKHGYSYGIGISEKQNVVIYWIVMW